MTAAWFAWRMMSNNWNCEDDERNAMERDDCQQGEVLKVVPLSLSPSASGGYYIQKEDDRMAKGTFKFVAKNGDGEYTFNSKTDSYDYKEVDYVIETTDLAEALQTFLDWLKDDGQDKITLSYNRKGKK